MKNIVFTMMLVFGCAGLVLAQDGSTQSAFFVGVKIGTADLAHANADFIYKEFIETITNTHRGSRDATKPALGVGAQYAFNPHVLVTLDLVGSPDLYPGFDAVQIPEKDLWLYQAGLRLNFEMDELAP